MDFTNDDGGPREGGGIAQGSSPKDTVGLEGGNGRGTTSEPSSYSGRPCYVIYHVVRFVSLSLSAVQSRNQKPRISLCRGSRPAPNKDTRAPAGGGGGGRVPDVEER